MMLSLVNRNESERKGKIRDLGSFYSKSVRENNDGDFLFVCYHVCLLRK